MCGHVGLAGDLKFKDEALIKRLLLFDYLRGEDGTGLAAVGSGGSVKMAKTGSHPLDLFDMGKFKDTCNGYNSIAFIGHNRAATRGLKNANNAHPYQFGRITGAHNGTLDNSCTKELEELLGEKFDVDSMAIFAAIDKIGIDETIPMLRGAWSLVWYDAEEKTLNFIRNKERPMWRAFSADCKLLLWASEWPMIDCATRVTGHNSSAAVTELWKHPEKGFRFMQNAEDWLYTYKLDELKKGSEEPVDARVKELKGKAPPPAVDNTAGADPFKRGAGVGHTGVYHYPPRKEGTINSTTTLTGSTKNNNATVIHLPTNADDPYGSFITPATFNTIAAGGCMWCKKPIEYGDEGVTIFSRDGIIVCAECSGGRSDHSTRIHLADLKDAL